MELTALGAWIKSLRQIDREKLAHAAGATGAYVTGIPYRGLSTVSLPLAVEIDKASGGKFDFRSLLRDNPNIDWTYVQSKLNEREVKQA